ncbi:hypothetical protein F4804DRAFT_291830 [Jackrogersella minutella]|nr:hypothetical protein F4804DRAFT_291830 [Jackrogersella minutella]
MDEVPNLHIDRRRRRPALSCVSCRRSKIRCDRNLPCGACVRSKHKTCVYEPQVPLRQSDIGVSVVGPSQPTDPPSNVDPETTGSPGASVSTHPRHGDRSHEDHSNHSMSGSTPVDSTSSQSHEPSFDVRSLLDRIRELERRLEEPTKHNPGPKNATRASTITTTAQDTVATYPSYLAGDLHTMNKSVMTKTRYLGSSHWMNQVGNVCYPHLVSCLLSFKPVLELFDQQYREKNTEAISQINKSKAFARTIKARRAPELFKFKFGTNVPPREIADKLVDGYLRTVESVFRILHVPSFRKGYEDFWTSPDSVDLSFVIQLQLVMGIGSMVYDDHYTLRKSAVQWVYEAQFWLISPVPKTRLTLAGLQVMLLLCIARQAASVGHDLVWISIGEIMRTAMFMGLHRDPKKLPRMNQFRSEMRRRLWNTILELALDTSVDSGGPPLICFQDYDTCAPTNCDDDQLADDDAPAIVNPPEKFTDMSMALALRVSFPARLAIARSLNEFGAKNTYDDTIRLHSQLSTAYKSLTQYLHRFAFTDRQPTGFQRRFVDLLVRWYFMAVHLPYFNSSMSEPAYAFSRKTVVETSTKLWCTVFPTAALSPRLLQFPVNETCPMPSDADDLARITTCAGGFFRSILSQASMSIGLEIQNQLQEDDGIGPPIPRMDLFNILHDSNTWVLNRIQIGETNIKGFMFGTALIAQAEGLMSGLKGAALRDAIVKAGIQAIREGFEVLKQRVELKVDELSNTNDAQFDFDAMMAVDEDWEYDSSMQNVFFDFTSIETALGVAPDTDTMAPPDFSQWQ